jgi:hypothetical protein
MRMQLRGSVQAALVIGALQLLPSAAPTLAQATPGVAPSASSERDGQHDFDFAMGNWKIHLSRLDHPLTGSKNWIQFDGTLRAHKIWDGRANVEEVELNSPTGPIEGLTVRFYNPHSPHFEQSYSNDGGKTWEVNWMTDQTRVADAAAPAAR